jgi:hypothetical protein
VPPLLRVTFGRGPIERVLGVLLGASALLVYQKWDSLTWHARGMILAIYGVTALAFGLNEVSRTRELLRAVHGPRAPWWTRKKTPAGMTTAPGSPTTTR